MSLGSQHVCKIFVLAQILLYNQGCFTIVEFFLQVYWGTIER